MIARDSASSAIASNAQYRLLFERNPNPMWVFSTRTLHFLSVNDAAISAYGYSREAFLRMTLRDIRPPELMAELEGIDFEHDGARTFNTRHVTRSGAILDVQVESHPFEFEGAPARLVLALDITDRRRAEAAALDGAQHYRDLFENVPVGLYRTTAEGRFIDANPALLVMLGYPDRESLFEIPAPALYVDPAERSAWQSEVARIGEIRNNEIRLRRPDGRVICVRHTTSAHFDASGNVLYYEGAIQDVTQQKQMESQLAQASRMEAIGKLAGGVAHDFNNILTAIQGQAQLLLDEAALPPTLRNDVREIESNARRAADLTRQLLAFSRQQILQSRVLDLGDVVEDMAPMLRRLIGTHVNIVYDVEPALMTVRADPGQIERIVLNMAVNAQHAMPAGGQLTIRLDNETLDKDYADGFDYPVIPGDYVRLSVEDTGEGMDSATQARIFEPFFTTREQGQGTGLGLATVYGVVKQSGGYIWVDSTRGSGTTFRIYLPAHDEPADARAIPGTQGVNASRGETVIVCEDEDSVRGLIKRVLERRGYVVFAASSPHDALKLVSQHRDSVRLLLTDIVMPGMGGRELARLVKERLPAIHIVLMSGYSQDDLAWNDGHGTDAAPFLQKPFTPAGLDAIIGRALAGSA